MRGKFRVVPNGDGTKTPTFHTGHGAPAHVGRMVRNANVDAALEARDKAEGLQTMPRDPNAPRLIPNNWGAKQLKKLRPAADVLRGNTEAAKNRFVQPNLSQTAQIPPPSLGNPRGVRSMD